MIIPLIYHRAHLDGEMRKKCRGTKKRISSSFAVCEHLSKISPLIKRVYSELQSENNVDYHEIIQRKYSLTQNGDKATGILTQIATGTALCISAAIEEDDGDDCS